ncbi:MAG: ATP-binding protein [Bacteroidota bacterium]|nr:ATP-binding protein [Bacteroidota bacterium]
MGFAIYFLYIGVILFFTLTNDAKFVILAGIISVVFNIVGYFFSFAPEIDFIYLRVLNRTLSIAIILLSMFGIIKFLNKRIALLNKINELNISNKEIESLNFISSHDLQEPLRKIQDFVNVLSEEKNLSDNGKYYLQKLNETSKQARMLIEDLLQYSRIKTTSLNFEKTNLNTIFEQVIVNFKETINEKKASVHIEGLCEANIIRVLFRQLIANLISNSLKFSHPDRQLKIIIKSESTYGSKLNIELSPNIKYCHISIIDNGIGFDQQYKHRIFDLFERLNGQKYPGTGLGLAICRRIIENHNGLITANGELNKGAQFDIYIPSKQSEIKLRNNRG